MPGFSVGSDLGKAWRYFWLSQPEKRHLMGGVPGCRRASNRGQDGSHSKAVEDPKCQECLG